MLIEEIINEWFGYKGIVSDVMDEYKLKIKEMKLFKENSIFWNIFLFLLLLFSYQLKFSFFKSIYEIVSENLKLIFLLLSLIVLFISIYINKKNFEDIKK